MAQGTQRTKEHLEAILPYATGAQKVYIEHMINTGESCSKAAESLGRNMTTITRAVVAAEKKAGKHNVGPDYHNLGHGGTLSPGMHLGKQTVHIRIDDNGNEVRNVWNRYNPEAMQLDLFMQGLEEAFEHYEPLPEIKPTLKPEGYDQEIVPFYNIGDAHIGMLAHACQTGSDFNIDKAILELSTGLGALIANTTPSKKGVIVDLGDGTHYENLAGVTSGHGHALDCDGLFVRMIEAYGDLMTNMIDLALKVHEEVDVLINQGNHSQENDLAAAVWLRKLYKNNPRVNILDNVNVFNFYTLDNVQILFHHGHKCKPDKLIDVMINDGRVDYGRCEHHYIWTGHVHHRNTSNEFRGISTESFNILADKDKYAHDGGWRSNQAITRVDVHRDYGEIGRATYNIRAVRAIIAEQGVEL